MCSGRHFLEGLAPRTIDNEIIIILNCLLPQMCLPSRVAAWAVLSVLLPPNREGTNQSYLCFFPSSYIVSFFFFVHNTNNANSHQLTGVHKVVRPEPTWAKSTSSSSLPATFPLYLPLRRSSSFSKLSLSSSSSTTAITTPFRQLHRSRISGLAIKLFFPYLYHSVFYHKTNLVPSPGVCHPDAPPRRRAAPHFKHHHRQQREASV